jgi:hypothetical protein
VQDRWVLDVNERSGIVKLKKQAAFASEEGTPIASLIGDEWGMSPRSMSDP